MMWSPFKALQKNKTLTYGIPMILLVVGGSFGLREFTQIRYDAQKIKKKLDPALEARINVQKQPVILEEEYEKMQRLNLDEWSNIRGPRPWENSREYQDQQRAQQATGSPGATGAPGPAGGGARAAGAQPDGP
ncbi:cytochrome c oxidase assembly protein COX16 homolog, mitochondrial [Anguilla anguilla]|uniref:cytochrome c oxidase assembly protein COX16 homolog, mitochondrial n=1 Tax=Anguilla anguilla TaxID=7936 RepID=UPI0015AA9551|nr:cytochrome c oxidase assembly protein COX16 homolog, mitochondrial [Anguilla anguilla]